ncbi:hypothetical protein, variant [Aphanomyces invadans]|uniref:Uncharacterized protein n=1 Tax=Aphanomyces invadans TaxID=157072 RepID=A0A024UL35_9STRA|nr:hypothetical protein H310_01789 [Aphanomyces invadans]XP_008863254.1 hypothetical protein, variant [Aphanomyces invadans]ETW07160.1 hypothetical protein H310_01789 [Aphanomyces invadans]ETW07161.1 hypothetical protein, variant [Aphanomyces invadans]|eukprot:XP_008863253.1 hypothetical protein H310_01789 [Aphanomyces invadans]
MSQYFVALTVLEYAAQPTKANVEHQLCREILRLYHTCATKSSCGYMGTLCQQHIDHIAESLARGELHKRSDGSRKSCRRVKSLRSHARVCTSQGRDSPRDQGHERVHDIGDGQRNRGAFS